MPEGPRSIPADDRIFLYPFLNAMYFERRGGYINAVKYWNVAFSS